MVFQNVGDAHLDDSFLAVNLAASTLRRLAMNCNADGRCAGAVCFWTVGKLLILFGGYWFAEMGLGGNEFALLNLRSLGFQFGKQAETGGGKCLLRKVGMGRNANQGNTHHAKFIGAGICNDIHLIQNQG